jgi:MFS family permease
MSVFHAMFSLGAGVGAASGYAAVTLGLETLVHFILVAGCGGALALFFMVPAQTDDKPPDEASDAAPILALPSGPLLLIGLIALSVSMGEGAMADWSAVFLRTVAGATEAQAALGYAAFSTTMVLTRMFGGALVQRLGPVLTTRLSGMIAFIGLLITISTKSLAVCLVGFALVGIGYAVVMPLVFSRAANDPTMRPGPAIASVATLGYGGMLLGPPVVGFIAQMTGLRVSFAALAALALLAVLLAPRMRISGKPVPTN